MVYHHALEVTMVLRISLLLPSWRIEEGHTEVLISGEDKQHLFFNYMLGIDFLITGVFIISALNDCGWILLHKLGNHRQISSLFSSYDMALISTMLITFGFFIFFSFPISITIFNSLLVPGMNTGFKSIMDQTDHQLTCLHLICLFMVLEEITWRI